MSKWLNGFVSISLVIVVMLIFSNTVQGLTNQNLTDQQYAERLSTINVFKGTENGFELEREPNRLEGIIMLIRLLGKEEEALAFSGSDMFTDVPTWAKSYVNYAYANGLTEGIGNDLFGSHNLMDAKSYLTFALRALGYNDKNDDFSWENAIVDSNTLGVIDSNLKSKLLNHKFLRGHVAECSYVALQSHLKNSDEILIDKLVKDGSISFASASNIGILSQEFYEWKLENTHIYSMSMSHFDKETIRFKIENNILQIDGTMTDPNKNYLRFNFKRNGKNNEKAKLKKQSNGYFNTEISLSDIKPNKLYSVEVSLWPTEYGSGIYWVYNDLFIKKTDNDIAFVVSSVYLMNNEKFDTISYEENSYLSSSYGVQNDDEDIIVLSKSITDGISTNYDKALAIHDWVADNIYYNYDAYYSDCNDYGDTSAKGTLEAKTSVCQGYANLTAALFRASGIPCKVVSGFGLGIDTNGWNEENTYEEDANHSWNEAYIDGRWIIIDTTWDSGNEYKNGQFIYEGIRYRKYFDTDISWFSLDHKIVNN